MPRVDRTTIDGVRVRSLTIRRRGNGEGREIGSAARAVNAARQLALALPAFAAPTLPQVRAMVGFRCRKNRKSRSGAASRHGSASAGRTEQERASEPRPPIRRASYRHTYGAVDLGTNNCRLLIARPRGRLHRRRRLLAGRPARRGLAHTGKLSEAAMDRAVGRSSVCADKLRRRNVSLARSVATEACRRAANGREFVERVRRETGIVLDIIEPAGGSAARGPRLPQVARAGRRAGPDLRHRRRLDRAGADRQERRRAPDPRWWSAPWGVFSLTESEGRDFEGHETARRLRGCASASRRAFRRFADMLPEETQDIRLLGTSGTVTTLASVHLALPSYDRRAVDGLQVPTRRCATSAR